jgi:undecaprenyl-diphosphatase
MHFLRSPVLPHWPCQRGEHANDSDHDKQLDQCISPEDASDTLSHMQDSPPAERAVMNAFDLNILQFFNQFIGRSGGFDYAMSFITDNDLLKGGVIMTVYWWLWFVYPEGSEVARSQRQKLFTALPMTLFALVLAQVLERVLPFRQVPLRNTAAGFRLPPFLEAEVNHDEESVFPSDHATLFFALATGVFLVHRFLGILAFLHAALVISLPRIYLLYHHPTDILAGALLGSSCVIVGNLSAVQDRAARPVLAWLLKRPAVFYSGAFLLTYQTAVNYFSARALMKFLYHILQGVAHRLG